MTDVPGSTPALPAGFRFGVTTAGFGVEGHYNGAGEPRNNWFGWERDGRVEPSGRSVDFWNGYERHLDRAADAGCDAFRLSVEWTRCEPVDGEFDESAFDRYRAILDACNDRGLEPLVTLHHFTHPWWLGEEFWLNLDSPERFAEWVGRAVDEIGPHVRNWVTVNGPNALALRSFVLGAFPPGRVGQAAEAMRCADHALAAHVLAYDEIHRRRADAVVGTATYTSSHYELDRLLTDVLLARRHDVVRSDLGMWLRDRRSAHEARFVPTLGRERIARRLVSRNVPLEWALPRTVAEVYASPHTCTVDVTQVAWDASGVGSLPRLPGRRTRAHRRGASGRSWEPLADQETVEALTTGHDEPGLEVWVVEDGTCSDAVTRPDQLRDRLAAAVALIDAGVHVGGYYHRTLVDSYEWGSFAPRSGLHGIDPRSSGRWSATDETGHDSAAAIRRLIDGLRAGDRSVLAR